MFEKFFGACTITLGLYLCLQLGNVFPSSSRVLMFKLSQIERFSLPTLQQSIKFDGFSPLKSTTQLNQRIIAY